MQDKSSNYLPDLKCSLSCSHGCYQGEEFKLLKLALFEMQGTFLFAMRHSLPTKAYSFETCFIICAVWRTL